MGTESVVSGESVAREGSVFRKTNIHKGRKVFITPQNSSMQYLCYARAILDQSIPETSWDNGDHETALICLSGEVEVNLGDTHFTLRERDSSYIPRNSSILMKTGTTADVAEFSAPIDGKYPLQIVRYADIR
jgi:5-deoxy-glucuronate isomerase